MPCPVLIQPISLATFDGIPTTLSWGDPDPFNPQQGLKTEATEQEQHQAKSS